MHPQLGRPPLASARLLAKVKLITGRTKHTQSSMRGPHPYTHTQSSMRGPHPFVHQQIPHSYGFALDGCRLSSAVAQKQR
eukprot:6492564-Amphidinium_carterae.2